MAKVWAVTLPGVPAFQIWDLPAGVLQDIADTHGVGWVTVVDAPFTRLGIAPAVAAAVKKHTGADVELPVVATAKGEMRDIAPLFDLVEDDLPEEYTDGVPPEGGDLSTAG